MDLFDMFGPHNGQIWYVWATQWADLICLGPHNGQIWYVWGHTMGRWAIIYPHNVYNYLQKREIS